DSRALAPGACFVALVAARDGHEFVDDAFACGASIALVTRPLHDVVVPDGAAIIQVDDAMRALAALGAWARDQLHDATVVGITGSTGKTGTKDLAAAAFGSTFRVHATPASFNAEIGLPITLVGAPADTEVLVLEMGARAPGDIARLCEVARPTTGVITNIGLAHAGPLGGPEGIARVKGELLEALPAGGLAVLDAGDAATPALAARTSAHVVLVSVADDAPHADVRAHSIELDAELRPSFTLDTPWGTGAVRLRVRGAHQVVNAALAATAALANGVPFAPTSAALATVEPGAGRLELRRSENGAVVLDDVYNASPPSMRAALAALQELGVPGRRIAVLGEMRELGARSGEEHARLGCLVRDAGVDTLVAVGPETAPMASAARERGVVDVVEAPDAVAALEAVRERVGAADAVLVKASRAVGLELVVRGLVGSEDLA
ncbi:MAG TPA: UDP-N-acetylmuramoyl-tripeptide--D-alanyl-D-alanine ligase, partial [Acidimicrobiia bacterium]|nr:UDP-N-acetylmuramoyl-tripeptide--D-alanyl-D-alanine ligase [Acidimicrobiia bacterium]